MCPRAHKLWQGEIIPVREKKHCNSGMTDLNFQCILCLGWKPKRLILQAFILYCCSVRNAIGRYYALCFACVFPHTLVEVLCCVLSLGFRPHFLIFCIQNLESQISPYLLVFFPIFSRMWPRYIFFGQ